MARKSAAPPLRNPRKPGPASAPAPRKRRWPRRLAWLALCGSAGLALTFIFIDYRIARKLRSRDAQQIPALYSAEATINASLRNRPKLLRRQLADRHYSAVESAPQRAGEFRWSDDTLEIIVRDYRTADGSKIPPQHVRYSLRDGRSFDVDSETELPNGFTLEPHIVAYLGAGDQRASSYRNLKEIPAVMQQAVLAVEDERFYAHHGVDPIAIGRAMLTNLRALDLVQGGSTITQQLAKNILLTPERTLGRKLLELFAAFSLERQLSKEQILELYLNEVYLGQDGPFAIHGVAEAARSFYGKKIDDINAAEAALLAGIIRAPSYYGPRKHPERAFERKDIALQQMHLLGYLDDRAYSAARKSKISVISENTHRRNAPYYVAAVEQEIASQFSGGAAGELAVAGLNIFSGLRAELQECAEQSVSAGIARLEKQHRSLVRKDMPLQAALIALEPHSGLVRAWVGGRDFGENQFNRVSQAVRQIGSTIKPFLYLTALDGNLNRYRIATATSILSDEPMKVDLQTRQSWEPENYDRKFRGDVTLRYALENSLNLPAVYIVERVGVTPFVRTLERFRIAHSLPAVPALALGAADTTLLRLTSAYGALANGGRYVAPRLFVSAFDESGEVVAASAIEEEQVADENAVYVLTNILQGVLQRGTGRVVRSLGFTAPAAGKTGTSNDMRDSWFVGFTPSLVAGVWVGYDDNAKIGLTGGAAAAPIWSEFMNCAAGYFEPLEFIPPEGVRLVELDAESLQRATRDCPETSRVSEVFVTGTEPQALCSLHSAGGTARERAAGTSGSGYRSRNDPSRDRELDRKAGRRSDEAELREGDQREIDFERKGRPRRRERSLWESLFGP